jgi:hypothetical protein
MQLRILETQGAVTQQSYTSTLSGQKFAAQYIANANPFDIEEVTFTAGEGAAADQRWNQIAALPVAVSMGELGYKRLVKKLTNANALANPLSYADAIKQ